jgi:hypothetical protein
MINHPTIQPSIHPTCFHALVAVPCWDTPMFISAEAVYCAPFHFCVTSFQPTRCQAISQMAKFVQRSF